MARVAEDAEHGGSERDVGDLGPGRELGEDLRPADHDLDQVERPRRGGQGRERSRLPAATSADHEPGHEQADGHRGPAVEHVGQDALVEDREEAAVHERPVVEDERGPGGGDVGAEQHQPIRAEGRQGGEDGEAAPAAAAGSCPRIAAADPDEEQDHEQGHRGSQVGGHDLSRQIALDRDLAQPRLEDDQAGAARCRRPAPGGHGGAGRRRARGPRPPPRSGRRRSGDSTR